MMQCPHCHKEVGAGRFCSDCGGKLSLACQACGHQVDANHKFCAECGNPLLPTNSAPTVAPSSDGFSSHGGERRHITVMFCDLIGSTDLSRRLDPEVLRDVMRHYQGAAAAAISEYEGFTAKFLGDGVLAYFGYPQAHEDDAQRAVRAGLKIITEIETMTTPDGAPLQVRIGISSGLVVVGDILQAGGAIEQSVIGETPNLAARLQELSPPNGIVVADATRRLLRGSFDLSDLGKHELKGFDQKISAQQVIAERRVASRYEAVRGKTESRFVGRVAEVEMLTAAWHEVCQGQGRGVLINGDPGIGKSRLIEHFFSRLAGQNYTRIRFQCSPYHANTEFFPIFSHLRYAARLDVADTSDEQKDKLAKLFVQEQPASKQEVAVIADQLGVEGTTAAIDGFSAEQRKNLLFDLMWRQLAFLAKSSPIVVLFEDLHWADASSLDFIHLCAERLAGCAILFLLTARPEFEVTKTINETFTVQNLSGLPPKERIGLVEELSGGKLPEQLVKAIVARTDGIPLFVEELTRGLQEGLEGQSIDPSTHAVPATLQDLLMEKLDRLGEAREVAQVASTIGREFHEELLFHVAELPLMHLQEQLDDLLSSGLITQRADGMHYLFRHALLQEAAHSSLLLSRRRELHSRVADMLEQHFRAQAMREPELVARHYDLAERSDQALVYYQRAAEKAAASYANIEAASHYYAALRCLEKLAVGEKRDQTELRIRAELGVCLTANLGYANAEVEENFNRARQLCKADPIADTSFGILRGLWNCHFDRGDFPNATAITDEMSHISDLRDETHRRPYVDRAAGSLALYRGDVSEADRFLTRAWEATNSPDWQPNLRHWVEDPGMIAHVYLSWSKTLSGKIDEGLDHGNNARHAALQLEHPLSIAFVTGCGNFALAIIGDYERLAEQAQNALDQTEEQALPFWHAWAQVTKGYADTVGKNDPGGIEMIKSGMTAWKETGAILHEPTHNSLLMTACNHLGLIEEARAAGAAGLAAADRFGENMMLAELQREHGRLARREGNIEEAHHWLELACATAREQGATLWLLKALGDLITIKPKSEREEYLSELRHCLSVTVGPVELPPLNSAFELINSC